MKNFTKLSLPFLLILLPLFLFAQPQKGKFILGLHNFDIGITIPGSPILSNSSGFGINIGSLKVKESGNPPLGSEESVNKFFSLGLNANLGYFFTDRFSGGMNFNTFYYVNRYQEEGEPDEKTTYKAFFIGPELRYYFQLSEKLKLMAKAGAGFGNFKALEGDGVQTGIPTKITHLQGGLNLVYFLLPNFSADLGLVYNHLREKIEVGDTFFGDDVTWTYTTNNVAIDLGFSVFLGRQKE